MTDASDFTKLVPGFDFLQSLVKNAGSALPGIGQWVAPTLNPEEIDKRIKELRTVQYWLEQNGRMLGATIQALEVQRMTLSTLQTMNVQMEGLRDSLQIKMPGMPGAADPPAAPTTPTAPEPEPIAAAADAPDAADDTAAPAAKPGLIDPMQWWGALTKQFTELATTAMKDTGTDAARGVAGAMVRQQFEAANEALAKATGAPAKAAVRKAVAKKAPAKKAAAGKKGAAAAKATPPRR